jgi:hypothetical protein
MPCSSIVQINDFSNIGRSLKYWGQQEVNSSPSVNFAIHHLLKLATMKTRPQKITFGELRTSGVRDVLIYCRDHRCSHHITISADRWPNHVRLSDIEQGLVCTACGKRGAELRPNFAQAEMGIG